MAKKTIRYNIKGDHDGTGLRNMRADADRSVAHVKGKMAGLSAALKGGLAGGLAGSLVGGFGNPFDAASAAIEKLDGIAKRARTSGLASGFYQAISVAANEASIAQGVLDSSLTAFVKRMGELQGGTGPLAKTLGKLDSELANLLANTTSQEQALRIVADRMATYDTAAQRAGVASALFSRAGVDLTRILSQGATVFDDTAAKAEAMGLIIEDGLLNRAEKLQNEFGLATQVLDVQFKSALVDIAPILTAMASGLGNVTRQTREQISPVQELASTYGGLSSAISGVWDAIKDSPLVNPVGFLLNGAQQGAEALLGQRSNAGAKVDLGAISTPKPSATGSGGLLSPPKPRAKPATSAASGLTRDLKQLNTVFDTSIEKAETWSDTLQRGLDGFGSSLLGVARGTESLNSLLDRTLSRFADMLADQAFNTLLTAGFAGFTGGPTNIVPSGFAGFFAGGGNIPAGKFGIAGEAGPEMITGPATVTSMAAMGSGGARVVINNYSSATVESDGGGTDAQGNPFQRLVVRDAVRAEVPGAFRQIAPAYGQKPVMARR